MTTETLPTLVAATTADADRETWMEARSAGRVTASEVHSIAVGGRSTWLRLLDNKLNGETFKGTASTARGRRREAFLIDFAKTFVDASIEENTVLFVHPENGRIGATPDGIGDRIGVEVKSLDFGADPFEVPAEHYDQMQLGLYVTGRERWLYVREVMGEDGEPTLDDPAWQWIERDETRIAQLVSEAEKFLAWWDAGAPASDDLDPELDDALAAWADARRRKQAAEADEKAADAVIRRHIAAMPDSDKPGVFKAAGRAAQFVYTVTEKQVLDVEAWAAAESASHHAWETLLARASATEKAASALYTKPTVSTRLNISPSKESA
jgi:hypothetical protein